MNYYHTPHPFQSWRNWMFQLTIPQAVTNDKEGLLEAGRFLIFFQDLYAAVAHKKRYARFSKVVEIRLLTEKLKWNANGKEQTIK